MTGAAEMAQLLKVLAGELDDPCLIPSTRMMSPNCSLTPVSRDLMSSSGFPGYCAHIMDTCVLIHTQAKQSNALNNSTNK